MALTSGFYNSQGGDRRYDAIQMSQLFDGLIQDGVFQSVGEALLVKSLGGLDVAVSTGRAWFDHTWTYVDAAYPIELTPAPIILNRIDAVVLEVNHDPAVRQNSLKVVEGSTATTPVKPTLTKTGTINQYPLAYIMRREGTSSVAQADITNAVGTSECPFVIGVVKSLTTDQLVSQWTNQWNNYFNAQTAAGQNAMNQWTAQFNNWFTTSTNSFEGEMTDFTTDSQNEFNLWFNNIKDALGDDAAAAIMLELQNFETRIATVEQTNADTNAAMTILNDTNVTSNTNRKIWVQSGEPTAAVNGDIWLKV